MLQTQEPLRLLVAFIENKDTFKLCQCPRVVYSRKIPQMTWFFLENCSWNHSPELFYLRIRIDDWNRIFFVCRGFSLPGFVWTGPNSTFASKLVWLEKLFSQFRLCSAKRPVPYSWERFTLEKYQRKHAIWSIDLKLNLLARQGHWVAWKETTVVICYN